MTAPSEVNMSTPEPPPPIYVAEVLWNLEADPAYIDDAAMAWRSYATAAREVAQEFNDRSQLIINNGWTGTTSDTFADHVRIFVRDLREAADIADKDGAALESVASSLRSAQGLLNESWSSLTSRVPAGSTGPGQTVFYPADESQVAIVYQAVRDAETIRGELDQFLLDDVAALERTRPDWQSLANALDAAAKGTVDPFTLPPEAAGGTMVLRDGNNVIVNTGTGDDKVEIGVDPATGEQIMVVNGVATRYPADANIIVRTGEGNDEVVVAKGTQVRVTLLGGEGNDTLRGGDGADTILGGDGKDAVYAGAGDDRVSGGADRDYIDGYSGNDVLDGGLGDDTVYGLSGTDQVTGGEGKDYLEGGTDSDMVDGGAGNDMMSGGRGDDTMRGGAGDDKMYAGFGQDTVDGGRGNDTSFSQTDDKTVGTEKTVTVELTNVGGFIKVEGSPEFVERVQADLDMLRSSPRGQAMLESLEQEHKDSRSAWAGVPIIGGYVNQGDTITIREYYERNSTAPWDVDRDKPGAQAEVRFNPSLDDVADGPPVTVLYHELAHNWDSLHDTIDGRTYDGTDATDAKKPGWDDLHNFERVAAGLPIDHDNDPSTPEIISPDHPYEFTENGLREEMDAPKRQHYRP